MITKFSTLRKEDLFRFQDDPISLVRKVQTENDAYLYYYTVGDTNLTTTPVLRNNNSPIWKLDEGVFTAMDAYKETLKIQDNIVRLYLAFTYRQLRAYIATRTGLSDQEVQEQMEEIALDERLNKKPMIIFAYRNFK